MAKSSFDKALSLVKEEYGEQSKETVDVCLKIALHSTTYEDAMKYVGIGEEILKGLEDTGGLADVYDAYGLIYERRHEPKLAREAYEEALKYCDMSSEDMDEKKFDLYLGLAGLDGCSEEDALQYGIEAEKLIEKLPEDKRNEGKIYVYCSIGNSYYNMLQNEDAIKYYEKVISCWTGFEYRVENQLEIAQCYDHCGYVYTAMGDFKKAIEYINQSLVLLEGLDNAELWDYAIAYRHLSVVYTAHEIQDYEKVMEYGLKSCQIYTKEKELSNEELEEFKMLKGGLQSLYEESPLAEQQDFEAWYQEAIKQ